MEAKLTPRQLDAVALVTVGGLPSEAAASKMAVSVRTISFHLLEAYERLGVKNRSQAFNKLRSAGMEAEMVSICKSLGVKVIA